VIWPYKLFLKSFQESSSVHMIASLPMYDFPHIKAETDAFWRALAEEFGADFALTRRDEYQSVWTQPALTFSQTCGYPLTHELLGRVSYVATPHYTADGCDGANYCSLVFARAPAPVVELAGKVAAVNAPDSMSGMLALKAVVAPATKSARFFAATKWTGSHVASLKALHHGSADVCAIDCVTVAHVRRSMPELLHGLFEVARGPSIPGLPYICAGDADVARATLQRLFDRENTSAARQALLLAGFSVLPDGAYNVITDLEARVGWIDL
jgi:ABC-type phosphate/phosphonate transport system substrate-binding protein